MAERTPPEERQILNWAEANGLVIRPREYREDKLYSAKVGAWAAQANGSGAVDSEERAVARAECGPVFDRNILLPNGLLAYRFHSFNETVGNATDLDKYLSDQKPYGMHVHWYLGPRLKNWQSERIGSAQRESNSILHGELTMKSDGSLIAGQVAIMKYGRDPTCNDLIWPWLRYLKPAMERPLNWDLETTKLGRTKDECLDTILDVVHTTSSE
jgi:hypothetical protein